MKIKNSKTISFSAPAKVHIIGEHAVVYGKPAIISAINLRLTLTLTTPSPHTSVIPEHREGISALIPAKAGIHAIQTAIENAIKKTSKLKSIPPYNIDFKSDFPIGSGLGASAAISATLTAALLKFVKTDFRKETSQASNQQIYDIAISGEKAIHGNPSGSDLAAVIFGGTIWFRKELPTLSLTSSLTSFPNSNYPLYLVDSGKPAESTGDMVTKVARLNAGPKKKTFDQLELLSKALVTNSRDIKQIFKEANACLVKLGVVSPSTQKLIKQIEKSGGAAKITGGGGWKNGSGMILVFHPHPEKLKMLNLELLKIKLGQEGLRIEK